MIDQVRDANQSEMFTISTVMDLPGFVKEASIPTLTEIQDLPGNSFACPGQRLFPVHTEADTWLSSVYFSKQANDIPEPLRSAIDMRLKEACSTWDLVRPEYPEPMVVSEGFRISYPSPVGYDTSVSTPEHVQKLAADINIPGKYPFSVRQSVARQLLAVPDTGLLPKRAADINVLQKVAGYGVGDTESILTALHQRRLATAKLCPPLSAGIKEASSHFTETRDQGIVSAELTDKVAHLIDAVDNYVGTRFTENLRPCEDLFRVTILDGSDFQKAATRLSSGHVIPSASLLDPATSQFLSNCLGHDVSGDNTTHKVAQELSPRDAQLLVDFLAQ